MRHPQKKQKQEIFKASNGSGEHNNNNNIEKMYRIYNRREIGYLNLVGGRRRSEIFSNGTFLHCFCDVINTKKKLIKNQVMRKGERHHQQPSTAK